MRSIEPSELKEMISRKEHFLLIDVREPYEHEAFNIGGKLMPLSVIMEYLDDIPAGKTVVFYCQKGIRSVIAIQRLQQKLPGNELVNLSGGVENWRKFFG